MSKRKRKQQRNPVVTEIPANCPKCASFDRVVLRSDSRPDRAGKFGDLIVTGIVLRRVRCKGCVRLWSNKGDLVCDPFAGIGSTGYVALSKERRFVGIELKRSYFETACRNLRRAVMEQRQQNLFAKADA